MINGSQQDLSEQAEDNKDSEQYLSNTDKEYYELIYKYFLMKNKSLFELCFSCLSTEQKEAYASYIAGNYPAIQEPSELETDIELLSKIAKGIREGNPTQVQDDHRQHEKITRKKRFGFFK